jgi:hypothetical protein
MKVKSLFLSATLLGFSQTVHAGLFDAEKSKIEFSLGLENRSSSAFRKTELSWDGVWHFEDDKTPKLKLSSKPYYKYSSSELQTAQERATKIGFDAIKASYEFGSFAPYISGGMEQQQVETNNSTGSSTKKDTFTSIGYGLTYSFGEGSGAMVTLYRYDKYLTIFKDRKSDETGMKLSFDLCKFFDKCKKKVVETPVK